MAVARYWRAVAVGYYTSGNWQGEMATFGISGVAVDGGGTFPTVILENLPTFDASPTADTADLTAFTVQYGSVGSGDWSKANQDSIATAMRKLVDGVKAYQDGAFSWQEIRVSAYDANHDVINGASIYTLKTPVVGTAGSLMDPASSACVSLRSGGRGPRARGRFYVPCVPSVAVTAGLLSTSTRSTIGTIAGDVIGDLQALSNVEPAIVSRTGMVYSTITRVQVGDVLDNVSRRRRRRRELYTAYAIS